MTPVSTLGGKSVALFGLGGSGLVTAAALIAGGARVFAWDDSEAARQAAEQRGVPIADLSVADWSQFSCLVLAPGVPLTHPEPHWTVKRAGEAKVEVIGDIELFCRERAARAPEAPLIAITGTNGKSTTTALIANLLKSAGRDVQLGGNIGTAVLELAPPQPDRFHVLEVSSFQIDLAPSLAPSIGVMLNLTPDHIDRHGTLAHYASVKERMAAAAELAVIGVDDEFSAAMAARRDEAGKASVRISVTSALPNGFFLEGSGIVFARRRKTLNVADLAGIASLRGRHNAQNAAAAIAVASSLGLDRETIQAGLMSFAGLTHRMEEIGHVGPIAFINDSKATNADSTEKALAAFDGDIFWIVGGKPKEGGISSLAPYFPRIAKAYLIGESAGDFAATLGASAPHIRAGTLDVAVQTALEDARRRKRGVVLLSPAAASYDQYKNYEQRGAHFRALVEALPGFIPSRKGA